MGMGIPRGEEGQVARDVTRPPPKRVPVTCGNAVHRSVTDALLVVLGATVAVLLAFAMAPSLTTGDHR
jgi:hypothetical protein